MIKIKKLYRDTHLMDDVVTHYTYENSQWDTTIEQVKSNVVNNQISNTAVVLGNGPSRLQLNPNLFNLLTNHRGGLLAAGRVQTYGCNAIIRDFTPDFLVATGSEIVNEIAGDDWHDQNRYYQRTIVYSTADAVLEFPSKFYLIPQNPGWNAGSVAAYLACFDAHKKIYLMGFDCYNAPEATIHDNVYANSPGYPVDGEPVTDSYFTMSLLHVMQTYNDVEFVRVMPTESWYCPDAWQYRTNFRQINFRQFTLEVDL